MKLKHPMLTLILSLLFTVVLIAQAEVGRGATFF
jgi:hypothetical protein